MAYSAVAENSFNEKAEVMRRFAFQLPVMIFVGIVLLFQQRTACGWPPNQKYSVTWDYEKQGPNEDQLHFQIVSNIHPVDSSGHILAEYSTTINPGHQGIGHVSPSMNFDTDQEGWSSLLSVLAQHVINGGVSMCPVQVQIPELPYSLLGSSVSEFLLTPGSGQSTGNPGQQLLFAGVLTSASAGGGNVPWDVQLLHIVQDDTYTLTISQSYQDVNHIDDCLWPWGTRPSIWFWKCPGFNRL